MVEQFVAGCGRCARSSDAYTVESRQLGGGPIGALVGGAVVGLPVAALTATVIGLPSAVVCGALGALGGGIGGTSPSKPRHCRSDCCIEGRGGLRCLRDFYALYRMCDNM